MWRTAIAVGPIRTKRHLRHDVQSMLFLCASANLNQLLGVIRNPSDAPSFTNIPDGDLLENPVET